MDTSWVFLFDEATKVDTVIIYSSIEQRALEHKNENKKEEEKMDTSCFDSSEATKVDNFITYCTPV